jgi:DNA-binding MarR family transcriptional regulator
LVPWSMAPGPAAKTARRDVRTTYLVKQLERAIRSEMDAMAREYDLTALQYTALSVLQRHPGMSSSQLARRSFVTAQAGSLMIALLERKGLISRAPDSKNRRILRIHLTPAGHEVVAACDGRMDKIEGQMLNTLKAADTRALHAALRACVQSLKPEASLRVEIEDTALSIPTFH